MTLGKLGVSFVIAALCFKVAPLILQKGAFNKIPVVEGIMWFLNIGAFLYFAAFWIIFIIVERVVLRIDCWWNLNTSGAVFGVFFSLLVFPISLLIDWSLYGYMIDFIITYLAAFSCSVLLKFAQQAR